jgi:NMD protein affecting ribosome stability and mRNA decay
MSSTNRKHASPESILQVISAVRQLAPYSDQRVAVKVEMSAIECPRCQEQTEIFVEPPSICATCWSQLVTQAAANVAPVPS